MNRASFLRVSVFSGVTLLFAIQNYAVTKKIPIPGTGGWDYVFADGPARRLYVSHTDEVVVVNLDSDAIAGKITGVHGVHGIAIASGLNRGFISAGRDNAVVAFDPTTLKTLGSTPTGKVPDGIVYEPVTHRVFTFNGGSNDATAVDATDYKAAGTIALGGRPEFPAADGRGAVFANIESTSEIVQIDARSLQITKRWSIKPCEGPSGLAIDPAANRLFSVCDKTMAVSDPVSGKVVATIPIGDGPDAVTFDPGTKLVIASNGEGSVTVVHQDSPDRYSVVQTLPTKKGARTLALDPVTHRVFLPVADLGPPPPASATGQRRWPSILPGTFQLLVLSR